MAEIDGKKTTVKGIIGLLLVLGGLGGGIFLTEDQFNNAYVCPLNENVGVFHRLSASEKTGYYYDTEGIEKRIACKEGRTYQPWESLKEYAENKGINPLSFLIQNTPEQETPEQETPEPPDIPPAEGKKWICSIQNCTRIS